MTEPQAPLIEMPTPTIPLKVPMTRPVSITIHETMLQPTKRLAADFCGGSVSELFRMLLYRELAMRKYITPADLERLS